jgi:hypothetical protein
VVVGKAALVLRSREDVRVDLQLAANPASARLRVSVVDRRAAVFRPTVRVADVRLT